MGHAQTHAAALLDRRRPARQGCCHGQPLLAGRSVLIWQKIYTATSFSKAANTISIRVRVTSCCSSSISVTRRMRTARKRMQTTSFDLSVWSTPGQNPTAVLLLSQTSTMYLINWCQSMTCQTCLRRHTHSETTTQICVVMQKTQPQDANAKAPETTTAPTSAAGTSCSSVPPRAVPPVRSENTIFHKGSRRCASARSHDFIDASSRCSVLVSATARRVGNDGFGNVQFKHFTQTRSERPQRRKLQRRTQTEIGNSLAGHHIIRTGGRTWLDHVQIEWVHKTNYRLVAMGPQACFGNRSAKK